MYRRSLLALVATVPLAGCLSDREFDADPVAIDPEPLTAAGYESDDPEPFTAEGEVPIGGVDVTVRATSWSVRYPNPDRQALLLLASTPDATVFGRSVNPFVRGDDAELLRRILERVGDDQGIDTEFERVDETGIDVLGQSTTVTTFATRIDAEGESVPGFVHFGTCSHDGDLVLLVGAHPETVDERGRQLSLMERARR